MSSANWIFESSMLHVGNHVMFCLKSFVATEGAVKSAYFVMPELIVKLHRKTEDSFVIRIIIKNIASLSNSNCLSLIL